MILKSLFVVACLAIYVRAQLPCLHAPEFVPHNFAASPLSCAHYTICMGGNEIVGPELQCSPGMYFDPPSQTCGQTSCLECSPFGIQNLAHPDDCYQYIECILGNRRILPCPSGLMFDRTKGQCNEAHLVYCPGMPTDPPWPTDTWPTETWPTDTWPTEPWPTEPWPTESPPGPVCRGQGQVFHAHPSDCTRFFMCMDDEILWTHQCPNDLHWNQLINACDFPQYAGCLSGGGGTTTPDPIIWPPTTLWPPDDLLPPPNDTTLFPPFDPWTQPNLLPPRNAN